MKGQQKVPHNQQSIGFKSDHHRKVLCSSRNQHLNWIVNIVFKVTTYFILIPIIILPSSSSISSLVQSKRILPERGGGAQYRTATACENSILEIVCEKDTHINLIRANFGRFSIQTCNEYGSQEMKVDCMSPISFRVMEESCGMKQSCVIAATSAYFGDPCPETPKYLEAHYQCLPDNQKKRYRWQSTTPRSKLPGKALSPPSTSSLSSYSSSSSSSSSPSSSSVSTMPSTISQKPTSSSELLKPDSPESNHVHLNASKIENSMKNRLTHPNSGYSVAAGTSTRSNNNTSTTYLDTTSSLIKSGASINNSTELRLKDSLSGSSSSSPSTLSPLSSARSTYMITSTGSISTAKKSLSPPSTTTIAPEAPAINSGSAPSSSSSSSSPLTIARVTNDFDNQPIYIKHPHPGAVSSSPSSIVSIIPSLDSSSGSSSGSGKSVLQPPYSSHHKSQHQLINTGSASPSSGESDYPNTFESPSPTSSISNVAPETGKLNKVPTVDAEYEETSIFIRHPHPGDHRSLGTTMKPNSASSSSVSSPSSSLPSTSTYDDQFIKIDPGSIMVNETTNQLSTDSWLSGNLSSSNLVTGIVFALGAALSAIGLFFYLYIRDTNIKSRFLSLASALNGKIICSRNIVPIEPGSSLKDDVATLRKRGGHLIAVTPTSKYMSSENAAHYIRDPIIGPGSGSTLNVIAPLGVKYLLPGNGNVNLGASVKDLTYGCSQLMGTLSTNINTSSSSTATSDQQQQFQLQQQQQQHQQQQQQMLHQTLSPRGQNILGVSLHQHTHPHHRHHHHLRPTATATGLPLPIGLVVEHVYECIDDDPYTAKLFMPVDCDPSKYQRRDNSIYNGGDFMLPINNHQQQHQHQQQNQQQQMQFQIQHHQQQQQQSTDLTATLQALPAIVQENVSSKSSTGIVVPMANPSGLSQANNVNPSTNNSHPHCQLNFACYPCQSQVASYINKDRIDQQIRENLAIINSHF